MAISYTVGTGNNDFKYYAVDGEGIFAPGLTFALSDPECGSIFNTIVSTDATGQHYLITINAPTDLPPAGTVCELVATAPDGVECVCPITLIDAPDLDCAQSTWANG